MAVRRFVHNPSTDLLTSIAAQTKLDGVLKVSHRRLN